MRTHGQTLLVDYQFAILCLSLKLYLKTLNTSKHNSHWRIILSFIVLGSVLLFLLFNDELIRRLCVYVGMLMRIGWEFGRNLEALSVLGLCL